MKKAVSVSLVLLLLTLTIGNMNVVTSNDALNEELAFNSSQYTEHEPIRISSNAALASQGFPGNGSVSNPYLIEGYSIEGSTYCISISYTNMSVLIRNCNFSNGGVFLREVTNISILGNIINDQRSYYEPLSTNSRRGIYLRDSNSCSIEQNEISGFPRGILVSGAIDTLISENRIYSNNVGLELDYDVHNATLHSNYIGWNNLNAEDAGFGTQWDDNNSRGNYWSDYDGSGTYEIVGRASSVDRYPSLWDEDFLGPDIQCAYPGYMTVTGSYTAAPDYYLFTANITDLSGIDCVYFALNNGTYFDREWVNYTMEYSPTPSNPNRYIYNYTFDEIEVIFYIIAIDILGYYSQTSVYEVFIGLPATQPIPFVILPIHIVYGICLGIIILGIAYLYKKSR